MFRLPGSSASEALPPLPASYYGTIKIDGSPAPANTLLTAKIDGEDRGDILTSRGEYGIEHNIRLSVEGAGADTGKTVSFYVGNRRANEEVQWSPGDVKVLALTFTSPAEVGSGGGGGSSGGGGGGGGGGTPKTADEGAAQPGEVVSDLPIEKPIEEESVILATVEVNQEAVFEFKESKVSSVRILFSEAVENPSLTIELSGEKPEGTIEIPENTIVYKYLSIEKNFDSGKIKGVTLHFKVETSWLAENKIYPEDVFLLHFNGSVWGELVTGLEGKSAGFYTFKAQTDDLSNFAIAARRRKTGSPYLIAAPALLGILAVIAVVILSRYKKARRSQR